MYILTFELTYFHWRISTYVFPSFCQTCYNFFRDKRSAVLYIYIYIHTHTHTVYVCMCIYVCMYVYVRTYVFMYVCMCVSVCMYICKSVIMNLDELDVKQPCFGLV